MPSVGVAELSSRVYSADDFQARRERSSPQGCRDPTPTGCVVASAHSLTLPRPPFSGRVQGDTGRSRCSRRPHETHDSFPGLGNRVPRVVIPPRQPGPRTGRPPGGCLEAECREVEVHPGTCAQERDHEDRSRRGRRQGDRRPDAGRRHCATLRVHGELRRQGQPRDRQLPGRGHGRAHTRQCDTPCRPINKKDGKVTTTQTSEVSADGKTRTVTTKGVTASGQKVNNIAVYEKQ